MKEKLAQLYNTLSTISTKGQDTIAMANCLIFIDQLVKDEMEAGKTTEENEIIKQV